MATKSVQRPPFWLAADNNSFAVYSGRRYREGSGVSKIKTPPRFTNMDGPARKLVVAVFDRPDHDDKLQQPIHLHESPANIP